MWRYFHRLIFSIIITLLKFIFILACTQTCKNIVFIWDVLRLKNWTGCWLSPSVTSIFGLLVQSNECLDNKPLMLVRYYILCNQPSLGLYVIVLTHKNWFIKQWTNLVFLDVYRLLWYSFLGLALNVCGWFSGPVYVHLYWNELNNSSSYTSYIVLDRFHPVISDVLYKL